METHYQKFKTRVLCLCPGYTHTNIYNTMQQRLTQEEKAEIKKSFAGIVAQGFVIIIKYLINL